MVEFKFSTAKNIIFGKGKIQDLQDVVSPFGKSVFIVTGRNPERYFSITDKLSKKGIKQKGFAITSEPTINDIQYGVRQVREGDIEFVISIGGGSAIDAGKAIAALAPNEGDILNYLEVIGNGQPLRKQPLPFIAIPTTAGTGSEVTKNAVINSPDKKVKVSLRSSKMFPRIALIDPELTISLPKRLTATTGMDALTQLIEPYISKAANELVDLFCREGCRRVGRSLLKAFEKGEDIDAREDMAFASMLSGLALANAGLGAAHGLAGPIGGMFDAPHGALCGRLIPCVLKVNQQSLKRQESSSIYLYRLDDIAKLVLNSERANANDLIQWLDQINLAMGIPRLCDYGVVREEFYEIIQKAKQASSMKSNPIQLNDDELLQILDMAF